MVNEPDAKAILLEPRSVQKANSYQSGKQPTSRVLYVVLALLFGCLGVHNFLAGYTQKGVIQLLISVFTLFFGACFVAIWALVEAFTVKEDANGIPFS